MDNAPTTRDNLSFEISPVAAHGQGTSKGYGRICDTGCGRGCVNGSDSRCGRRHSSKVSQVILLLKMSM